MTYYLYDAYGRYAGQSEEEVERSTPIAPAIDSTESNWNGIEWVFAPNVQTEPIQAPLPQVPASVSMRQARLALLSVGMLDAISAAIGNMPSPQKEAAQIEWEYSNEVQRHNGFVDQLGPALGLTSAQLDNLFIAASKL